MNNTMFALITIVSALVLFGVIMVTVASIMQLQEAEARGFFPNPNAAAGG